MTPEEFRAAGHRIVDWIADYRARAASLPVMARTEPGDVKRQLPASPPVEAEAFEAIVADLDRIVVPALSHWQHPRFFGYFPSNGLLASVLGDYVSTGLGVLGLSWQSSPALTEVEEVVTDWLRQMCGLSHEWTGVIQDTASTSTLVALISAREKISRLRLRAAAACRTSRGRSSSTSRRRPTVRWTRRRCWPVSGGTTFTSCRPMRRTR